MTLGFASSKVNSLVRKTFGLGFRADWSISPFQNEDKFSLRRSRVPHLVATASRFLPSFIWEPKIVAQLSFDGSQGIAPERLKPYFDKYSKLYTAYFGQAPDIKFVGEEEFEKYIEEHRADYYARN